MITRRGLAPSKEAVSSRALRPPKKGVARAMPPGRPNQPTGFFLLRRTSHAQAFAARSDSIFARGLLMENSGLRAMASP